MSAITVKPAPRAETWRLWAWIAVYWLAQAPLVHLWFSLLEGAPSVRSVMVWLLDWRSAAMGVASAGVLLVVQAVYLFPVRRPAPLLRGRFSMWLSMALAGLCIGLLASWLLTSVVWVLGEEDKDWANLLPCAVFGGLFGSWIVATTLLICYCRRGRREAVLGRVAAFLLVATAATIIALIPLDLAADPDFFDSAPHIGLWFAGQVGLFALGPALFLPRLRKAREPWYAGHCASCGYDMTGLATAERCPECGTPWRSGAPAGATATPQARR